MGKRGGEKEEEEEEQIEEVDLSAARAHALLFLFPNIHIHLPLSASLSLSLFPRRGRQHLFSRTLGLPVCPARERDNDSRGIREQGEGGGWEGEKRNKWLARERISVKKELALITRDEAAARPLVLPLSLSPSFSLLRTRSSARARERERFTPRITLLYTGSMPQHGGSRVLRRERSVARARAPSYILCSRTRCSSSHGSLLLSSLQASLFLSRGLIFARNGLSLANDRRSLSFSCAGCSSGGSTLFRFPRRAFPESRRSPSSSSLARGATWLRGTSYIDIQSRYPLCGCLPLPVLSLSLPLSLSLSLSFSVIGPWEQERERGRERERERDFNDLRMARRA